MNSLKKLAYAVFFVFLCIAPIFANAQDGTVSRLLDVPNVENDTSTLAMTLAIRDALSEAGHIVFSEEEMVAAAQNYGFSNTYWLSESDIARINEKVRHDAVVRLNYNKGAKKSSIIIYINNAYTGETMAELERSLKKKGKLTQDDIKAIVKGVNKITADIKPIEYSDEITITITSTPSGATVTRGMEMLGTTPLEYKMNPIQGVTEQWSIAYPDRDPVSQLIYLDKTNTYDVNIPSAIPKEEQTAKSKGGTGRPVFLLGFNPSPTIRKLDSKAQAGKPVAYTTQVFPVYSFDFDFFPFGLMSDPGYVQGLGLSFSFGFGLLDSKLAANGDETTHKCKADGNAISCETTYIRFNADIVYRLLMQKKEGKLNPDGLALDFLVGFNLAKYTIDQNTTYVGHDYTGIRLGARFSTPLGLRQLRLDFGAAAIINFGQGDLSKLAKWGSIIEKSWGINASIHLLYDIWKGIFLRAGYSFTLLKDDFGGVGCLDSNCLLPRNAESSDFYHEIQLGLGYMFY